MTPRLRVLMDTNGGKRAGVGHIVRSIALAERMVTHGMAVEFLPAGDAMISRLIQSRSFSVLSHPSARSVDAPDILVIDRPDTSVARIRLHRRRWPNAALVVLDYYGPAVRGVDAVVNLNRWRVRTDHGWSAGCVYRQGLEYAVLRSSFPEARSLKREPPGVRSRVVVAFGGTDARNWTLRMVRGLTTAQHKMTVDILVGRQQPQLDKLVRSGNLPHTRLHTAVSDPAPLLARCDVAVVGGGTVMMEAACLGIPCVVVPRTSAERKFARDFAGADAAVIINCTRHVPVSRVVAAVEELARQPAVRQRMSRAGRRLIDGLGTDRVVEVALQVARTRT